MGCSQSQARSAHNPATRLPPHPDHAASSPFQKHQCPKNAAALRAAYRPVLASASCRTKGAASCMKTR
jgi:hypothetical protein